LLAAPVQARNITNDCACAEAAWGGVASSPALAPFQQTPDTLITPLRDNYRLAFSPLAPHGPSVLNDSAYQRWQSFATPQAALQAFDSQLIEQQLIQPLHERPQWLQETPETLTAWLHITNACNLNCTYCYVHKSSQRMSQETGEQAVDALFAAAPRQGFREIKLKYAGGEPTLHLSLVKHLHHYAQARSQATNIPVQEVLLTNGVHISAQNARWLRDAGIKLAISLDGIGASHDAQRPMANGSGSFAAIAHTIDDILLPLGIHPDITLTITRLNTHAVAEATRWILQRHLPLSLNFYRSNANVRNPEALRLEEQAIILGMKAAYAVFEEILPQHPFLDGLLDRVQSPAHARTCGVDSNYVAISHTGNLAQCQMSLEQTIGHVRDGINLDTQRRSFIHNIPVEEKEDCRTCPFRYRCSGGCPLETYRATGRWDAKSPHCNIYRELYPLALRLEGLRLLKAHGL
jgi:uncharacterized protein